MSKFLLINRPISLNFRKKAGFSSLFRFSKDKKPKKDESIEDPAVENMIEEDSETATSNYPKYKNEDDYMPYDHRVDSRKASEVVEPFRRKFLFDYIGRILSVFKIVEKSLDLCQTNLSLYLTNPFYLLHFKQLLQYD